MYGLFYPETGERHLPNTRFATQYHVEQWMHSEIGWSETPARDENDLKAWVNNKTGNMLVMRRIRKVHRND